MKTLSPSTRSASNPWGTLSLLTAVGGFIAVEVAGHLTGWGGHWSHTLVLAGFEAGTVGALADWFAVTALFQDVRVLGLRIPHTGIIRHNREKIVGNIASAVANEILTVEMLEAKIKNLRASEFILPHLLDKGKKGQFIAQLLPILRTGVEHAPMEDMAPHLTAKLRELLPGLDLASPIGRFLGKAVENGDHQPMLDAAADFLVKKLEEPATRRELEAQLVGHVENFLAEQKEEGGIKGLAKSFVIGAGEWSNLIKPHELAAKLYTRILVMAREAKGDPNHPLRTHLVTAIKSLADDLAAGRGEAARQIQAMQSRIASGEELEQTIKGLLGTAKAQLLVEMDKPEGAVAAMLGRLVDDFTSKLQKDDALRMKVDQWAQGAATDLMKANHPKLEGLVKEALMNMEEDEMVRQIQARVGDDLQYIRLNGAVVGALAGIVLATVKMVF